MKFRTKILQSGKTAAGIEVPPEVVAALGSSKKPAVKVTLNGGYTYRSTVATMGGKFMIGVSNAVRAEAGVAGGEMVDVELVLDTEKREVAVHPALAAALAKEPKAKRAFESLSYSNQRRYAEPIADTKSEETRQRRIDKAISELKAMPVKK